jgi:MFS transporter, AAHS family, 4-hydroxybenzoate transporter
VGTRASEIGALIDERPLSKLQFRVIALCAIVVLFDGYDIQAMALAVPSIASGWSLPPASFGIALSAAIIGLGVGSLLLAPLGDRLGRRPAIISGLAVVGAASLGTAAAESIQHLILWRFVMGLGLGASLANATALTSEYVPARRRTAIVTLIFCNVALGATLAGFTAPALIEAFGWRGIFVAGGIVPLALSVVLLFALPESIRYLLSQKPTDPRTQALVAGLAPDIDPKTVHVVEHEAVKRGSVAALLSQQYRARTTLIWCVFGLNLFVVYLLISWLPTLLRNAGWNTAQALQGAVMIQIGGIIGGLLCSWLADRGKAVQTLVAAYLIAAVTLGAFMIVPPDQWSWMTLILFLGCGISGAQLALFAMAAGYYPPAIRATGLGWAAGISRVGAISGPLVGGWIIQQQLGTAGILGALIVPTLLCAVAVLFLPRVLRATSAAA